MFRSFWENLTIKQKLAITAWLFLAIPIIFYITIRFYPTYEAFYVSFMKWNLLGAKKYITGEGSKSYLKEDLFTYKNIKIDYIKKKDLKYSQPFMSNNGFIPDLSIIDYLFSNGFQSFKKII